MDFRLRTFDPADHVRSIERGTWEPLVDPEGIPLSGIVGKRGVVGTKADGTAIGTDFIMMLPGAEFALHTHEGEHNIYFIAGMGFVDVGAEHVHVRTGSVIHIPAELPHRVSVPHYAQGPLIFAATGHPHHDVHARDRMQLVEEDHADQSSGVASGV